MHDVIVIGAGPAGATTARCLARAGLEPLLLEKASALPRDEPGTGILTEWVRRCLLDLDLELPHTVVRRKISRFTVTIPGGKALECDLAPYGFLPVRRSRFDHFLVEEAVRAGVDLRIGWEVEAAEPLEAGGWRIQGGPETLTSRVLVLATGLRHSLSASLGFPAPPAGMSVVMEVDTSHGRSDPRRMVIEVGSIPRGFFWICPLRDRTFVGLASTDVRIPDTRRLLNAFMERHGLATSGILSSLSAHIAGYCRLKRPCMPGLVLVGDQFPAANPLTGFGLDGALLTGVRTAETVTRALARGRFDFSAHEGRLRRDLERDFLVADRIAAALFGRPARFLEGLREQPDRLRDLALCVTGNRPYRSLTRRLLAKPFDRFLQSVLSARDR